MVRPVGFSNQDNSPSPYPEEVNVVNQSHRESQDLVRQACDMLHIQNQEAQNIVKMTNDFLDKQSKNYHEMNEMAMEIIEITRANRELLEEKTELIEEKTKSIEEKAELIEKKTRLMEEETNRIKMDGIKIHAEYLKSLENFRKLEEERRRQQKEIEQGEDRMIDEMNILVENGKEVIALVDASEKKTENIENSINGQSHAINVDASNKETSILGRCCEIVSSIVEGFFNFVKWVYRVLVEE